MGATHRVTIVSTAGSTANDSVTIIAAAARSLRILEVSVEPDGTASAANVLGVYRSTGGTTGTAPITPSPTSPGFAAAGFTAPTAWSVQPTAGVLLDRISFNANGGRVTKSYAMPGSQLECSGATQLSFRQVAGTSTRSISILVEEF